MRAKPDLSVDLAGIRLPNPIIAASGTFGFGDELAVLCPPAELGAVTAKSVASFAWPGNDPVRVAPAPGGAMVNSVGLAGPGVEHWTAHDLPALRATGARVIASVWGRTVDEFAAAARGLAGVTDELVAVEVNASCPNLEARRDIFAHDPSSVARVTGAVHSALGETVAVFTKLSPNVTDIAMIAGAALDAGASGLTLVNTVLGLVIDPKTRRPRLGAGSGGLSGPPIRPIALQAICEVRDAHGPVPIIGTGGVSSGSDAVEMLLAGATAVGVGTATFADPRATLRVRDELERWCRRRRVERVRDLIGGLQR